MGITTPNTFPFEGYTSILHRTTAAKDITAEVENGFKTIEGTITISLIVNSSVYASFWQSIHTFSTGHRSLVFYCCFLSLMVLFRFYLPLIFHTTSLTIPFLKAKK